MVREKGIQVCRSVLLTRLTAIKWVTMVLTFAPSRDDPGWTVVPPAASRWPSQRAPSFSGSSLAGKWLWLVVYRNVLLMHRRAAGRRSVQVQLRSARRWNKEWLEHEFPALNVVRHSLVLLRSGRWKERTAHSSSSGTRVIASSLLYYYYCCPCGYNPRVPIPKCILLITN